MRQENADSQRSVKKKETMKVHSPAEPDFTEAGKEKDHKGAPVRDH